MGNQSEYQMTIHTRGDVIGHFTVELTGPSINDKGRFIKGFAAKNFKASPSTLIEGNTIEGTVRDDLNEVADKKFGYLSSNPTPLTREQALRAKAFIDRMDKLDLDYDVDENNCVDFVNAVVKAANLPGDVDDYITLAQKNDLNGAQVYNDSKYGTSIQEGMTTTTREALGDLGVKGIGDQYINTVVQEVSHKFKGLIGTHAGALVSVSTMGRIAANVIEGQVKVPGKQPPVRRGQIVDGVKNVLDALTAEGLTERDLLNAYARLMKRSKLATAVIEPVATWRATEIAYQMGERAKPHYRGKAVRAVMEPLCWLIGWVIETLPGEPDRFHPYLGSKTAEIL